MALQLCAVSRSLEMSIEIRIRLENRPVNHLATQLHNSGSNTHSLAQAHFKPIALGGGAPIHNEKGGAGFTEPCRAKNGSDQTPHHVITIRSVTPGDSLPPETLRPNPTGDTPSELPIQLALHDRIAHA